MWGFVYQVTPCSNKVLLLQKEIHEVLDHKGTSQIVRTHPVIMQMGKLRLMLGSCLSVITQLMAEL